MPQDSTSNDYGPFTEALTGPLTPKIQSPSISYAPSRVGALASFANSFIQGAQAGARSKYEQSEQKKMESERHMDQAFAHYQNDPTLSTEGKQAMEQAYISAKFGKVQEHLKGAKDAKDHPLINLVKGIAGHITGPTENKNHKDFDVNSIMSIANDPKYKIDPNASGADSLESVLGQTKQPPAAPGAQPQQQPPPAAPPSAADSSSMVGRWISRGPMTRTRPGAQPQQPAATPGAEVAGQPAQTQPEAQAPPASQTEAWANPKFRTAIADLQKKGVDWQQTQLGQWYAGLPKAGVAKPIAGTTSLYDPNTKITTIYQRSTDPATGKVSLQALGEAPPPKASANAGRPVNIGEALTIEGAKASGDQYEDALNPGHYIDLNDPKIAGMQLKGIGTEAGLKFMLFNPTNQTIRAGGRVYEVNSRDAQNLAKGAGADLGPVSAGTNTTHEVPVVDAEGNTIAVPMHGSNTPNTPGIPGRSGIPQRPAPPQQVAPVQNGPMPQAAPQRVAPPGAGRTTPPSVDPRKSSPMPVGGRLLPGMQSGEREKQMAIVRPVRAAAFQIAGDPNHPETKSLLDYAQMADNPAAAEKLGTAFKIAMDAVHKSQAEAGGIGEWIKNVSGAQAAIESSRAQVLNESLKDLQQYPGALDAFNATLSAFSTAVGLRSISKAAGSQASVATIERDLPLIGVNTTGSRDFYNKLSHYAQEINDGSKGLGEQVFEKGEREYLRGGVQKKIAGLIESAPEPSKKSVTNKAGKTIKIGDLITLGDGKQHKVKAFTANGGIIPE